MPIRQVYLLLLASNFVVQKGLRFGNGSSAKMHFNLRFTFWKNNALQGTNHSQTVFLHYIAYCFGFFVYLFFIKKRIMIPDYNFWILILCLIILVAVIIYVVRMDNSDRNNKIKTQTVLSDLLYLYGHPQLVNPQQVELCLIDEELVIRSKDYELEACVSKNQIVNLKIIDKSTLAEEDPTTLKVYLGYWGLLASRMPIKKNLFLLNIVWEDKQGTHITTFEFSGHQAARNVSIVHMILSDALL